jgi:hypothetical protein
MPISIFRRKAACLAALLIILASSLTGCSRAGGNSKWNLDLVGAISETLSQSDFYAGAELKCHGVQYTDSQGNVWQGIPLWYLVGRVDDNQKHQAGAFNDELARRGYSIEIVAQDQPLKLSSQAVQRNNRIIVAHKMNGNPLTDLAVPLRLVGADVDSSRPVVGIASIKLIFTP